MGKIISKVLSVLAVPAVAVIAMPWAGILDRLETRSAFAGKHRKTLGARLYPAMPGIQVFMCLWRAWKSPTHSLWMGQQKKEWKRKGFKE